MILTGGGINLSGRRDKDLSLGYPRAFIVHKNKRIERMEFMLVEIRGKQNEETLITTSRKVAEVFEKEHYNVLRDIETLS